MKYSIILLFHSLLAGMISLLALFLFQTMVRRLFVKKGNDHVTSLVNADSSEFLNSLEKDEKHYSPHAIVMNLIQVFIPAFYFLFPLSLVILSKEPAQFNSLVLLTSVVFLSLGILIAEKKKTFRAQNPYPLMEKKDENN
jgi:hypothetical protein